MTRWLVDGMNVVGSRPDGWWRDRAGAMRDLALQLARFAEANGDDLTVVFDGRPFEVDADPADVRFATRRGPNAADDEIARMVSDDADPNSLRVVTSDRDLAERVSASGAAVEPAGGFRRRLDAL